MLWMWGIIKIHVGICFIDIQCLPGANLKKYLQEETALQRLISYDVWLPRLCFNSFVYIPIN
jgi:hypothetical protein